MGIVLSSIRAREIEEHNINFLNIESKILMEKASIAVCDEVIKHLDNKNQKILIMAGNGNNGADGIATARNLLQKGYPVSLFSLDGTKGTLYEEQLNKLKNICDNYSVSFDFIDDIFSIVDEYTVCVDALFGTGINRDFSESIVNVINVYNNLHGVKVSIDVPSGLNSTTGEIYNACIKADYTIVLGTYKIGELIGIGPDICGKISVNDIGLWIKDNPKTDYYYLDSSEIIEASHFFIKKNTANKGTYGKTLVIAGSDGVYGACYFAAKASLISGAGMVKIFTHSSNAVNINKELPEAMLSLYNDEFDKEKLLKDIEWSTSVVIGPGLGMDTLAHDILQIVIETVKDKVLIIDADAINILSKDKELYQLLLDKIKNNNLICVMTPHKKELQRIMQNSGFDVADDYCRYYYDKYLLHIVDKDANTKIYGAKNYINLSGNEGMATAGSGDILSGILGGLLYRFDNMCISKRIALCVYVHGRCGDIAASRKGSISMTAGDILNAIPDSLDFLT